MLLDKFVVLCIIGCTWALFSSDSDSKGDPKEVCKAGKMKCAHTDKCVPLSWKCDGDNDCSETDFSDEENCPPKTCAEHEVLCADGVCIPDRWQCDGEADCPNGEDENATKCANDKCEKNEFKCGDSTCINEHWRCDGVEDCSDGSDEHDCTETCEQDMFTCADGQCISNTWTCDGDEDCRDGSDEKNCEEKQCRDDEFKCDSTKCIDYKWKCDGDFDCLDHSDEYSNCTYNPGEETEICKPDSEFKCSSGECIHKSWKCDGDPDCTDGSDEGDFCEYKCRDDQFQCANNYCIPASLRCDQSKECLDGSDEFNCTATVKCEDKGEFDCYGDNSYCIPTNQVCDGHNDCAHREDEDPALCKQKDPCETKTCPDHSTCVSFAVAYNRLAAKCTCHSGFEWHEAEQVCKDIDECKERGVCSQLCNNTKGGYKCQCLPGYVLEKHYFCRAEGEVPWLYYANRRDIRKLRIDSRYEDVVVNSTSNSVALDMDLELDIMFYTDSGGEEIKSLRITHTESEVQTSANPTVVVANMEKNAFAADGIAVDWLYKHIFWTDTKSNTIRVATYNGTYIKTLIRNDLDEPRAIALDPENGYMYWTDWGKVAKIERCGMDGNNRQVIVSKGDGLEWPNGLTIDYVDMRIYWIDSKLHKIGSAKMDGTDYYHVLVDAMEIQKPFSIAVFEDSLYWTDWHTNSIRSVNKISGRSPTTLSLGSYSVMGIKVYHAMKQNRAFAATAKGLCDAAQCAQLCLPVARININASQTVVCSCSDGYTLNTDKKTCTKSAVVPTTIPTTPSVTKSTKGVPTKVTVQTTGGYTVISTAKPTNETQPRQGEPTGKITIIVAVSLVAFIVVIAVIAFILYRRVRNRNKKSMHFDNPVYRKTTTDDQCMIPDENVPPQMQRLTSHESV